MDNIVENCNEMADKLRVNSWRSARQYTKCNNAGNKEPTVRAVGFFL